MNRDETEYKGCGCGNVMMQGHRLGHCESMHYSTEESLRWCELAESVFVVGAKGISITRLDKVSAKVSPKAILLKCDMCCSTFKIVIPRPEVDTACVQFMGEVKLDRRRRMSVPCKMQQLTTMMPPPLKRFVAAVSTQRVAESITSFIRNQSAEFTKQDLFGSDAPDPETMFREEPIICVGTFTETWNIPATDEC